MIDIEYYTSEATTLLNSLIGIPSLSREEEAAADFLQNYIEETGIMTGRSGNNIWCISPMFDLNKPTILLNSHIDTVKPVNGWRKHPFTPKAENGKIYGLGSNDAGASVVSLFQVYRHLSTTEQAYNLIFLASCEEEVSGKNGIESVLPQLPPITLGIVGEPTEMQPAIAEKGLMVLDVT
ncbi:M20/M25/M40 family metallo-hydrolase, partial [Bacteroides uniformis]